MPLRFGWRRGFMFRTGIETSLDAARRSACATSVVLGGMGLWAQGGDDT
jgi:hypothetical protein